MTMQIPERLVFLNPLRNQENISVDESDVTIHIPQLANIVDIDDDSDLRIAVFEASGDWDSEREPSLHEEYMGSSSNGMQSAAGETVSLPVEENQRFDGVEVVDVGDEGDGIVKIDGFVVFIPDGYDLLGEQVDIKITEVQDSHADAELLTSSYD